METTAKAELQGSEKQISYANDIRKAALKGLEPIIAAARAYIPAADEDEYDAQVLADTLTAYTKLLGETSAAWWINHRSNVGLGLIILATGRLYSKADFRFFTGR